MENLTTRQIAEKLGYSTEAIRKWKLASYTPDAVAAELRVRASRKFVDAAATTGEAMRMQEFANELERVKTGLAQLNAAQEASKS